MANVRVEKGDSLVTTSPDIDFADIAPRGGSQDHAFEELCCQLAFAEVVDHGSFTRIRGDGGDGGVECTWITAHGETHGLQAKYMFDLGRALIKAGKSLAAARKRHPSLTRYVICLPFDLSGSRGRGGKSEQDKFAAFKQKQEAAASLKSGTELTIELWTAFNLRNSLTAIDASGGRRRFWFDAAHLGPDWFSQQLDTAIVRAGPRYSPALHTGHVLDATLAALGGTETWQAAQLSWSQRVDRLALSWERDTAARGAPGSMHEAFPASALASGEALLTSLRGVAAAFGGNAVPGEMLAATRAAQHQATVTEQSLAEEINERFGPGSADSTRFRQFQAEYQCSFPAGPLDRCREAVVQLDDLTSWLEAPAMRANTERVLLLTGPAGIGKTHGLCDAAEQRRAHGLPTILVSGGQFSSDRSVWECLASAVGLDGTWSRDVLLDALDAAGAFTGRLLVCIDALDEGTRRSRWLDDLPEVVQAISARKHLALCVSVRDGYERQVVRQGLDLARFEHPGFGDAVFDACASFFNHFGLEPPIGPLLEPEYANPLFLVLLCRTLVSRGLKSVPAGWRGTKRVLDSLLVARDEELRLQEPGVGNRAVSSALDALAKALPDGGTLGWLEADRVVQGVLPASQQTRLALLPHLVGLGLIRVSPGDGDGWTTAEDRVDIAFGRLRHHLVAAWLTAPDSGASDDELRLAAVVDPGLAESLSLIMPERGRGELVDLASDPDDRASLMSAWVKALPWRESETMGTRVEQLVMEALGGEDPEEVLDGLFTLALRPGHPYDHRFLHAFFARHPMPRRDRGLCSYLHRAFERESPPSPIVRALRGPWESDPRPVERTLREAWCFVLGWCGAAADRRVRDHAAKSAVRLTECDPGVWTGVLGSFADVDDDSVLERVLCAAYGALLRNPDPVALAGVAAVACERVLRRPSGTPQHALVRGHVQSIGELAAHRGALPPGLSVGDFRPPHDTPKALVIPSKEELERYEDGRAYPQIYSSVMSEHTGDFAKYTMPFALGHYGSLLRKDEAQRWVLGTVMELGYDPDLHAPYDRSMLVQHGGLRGRPGWAERIGKKYQRIALNRLVGILDDLAHVQGKPHHELACERLRDLDPSLLQHKATNEYEPSDGSRWWEPALLDFSRTASLTDAGWVADDDFPDPAAFVAALIDGSRPGQRWRLLEAHFAWDDRGPDRKRSRYRDAWMSIKGYLVARRRAAACWKALDGADFMGQWMVEGFDREGGIYVGEYPWAPAFGDVRTGPDVWGDEQKKLAKFQLRPVTNRLIWPGDSWQEGSVGITVPAAELVDVTATRWDGASGFQQEDGRLVFQDPSVVHGGPGGLWVDEVALAAIQARLEVDVFWTVLAERRVIGADRRGDFSGMKHISTAMWFDGDNLRVRRGSGEHFKPDHTKVPL